MLAMLSFTRLCKTSATGDFDYDMSLFDVVCCRLFSFAVLFSDVWYVVWEIHRFHEFDEFIGILQKVENFGNAFKF